MRHGRAWVYRGGREVGGFVLMITENERESMAGVNPYERSASMLFPGANVITMERTPWPLVVAFMRSTPVSDVLIVHSVRRAEPFATGWVSDPQAEHVLELPAAFDVRTGDVVRLYPR